MNFITAKTTCDTLPALADLDASTLACLAGGDGVAVAIALVFAFCGAVFFSPSKVK